MQLADDQSPCVEYLRGDHTITQRMFHHNPAVMLYTPLRVPIYQDPQGRTRFSVGQPSTRFASFGNPEITKVGFELDRKLAALLRVLKAPAPPDWKLITNNQPSRGAPNDHHRAAAVQLSPVLYNREGTVDKVVQRG